MRNLAGSEPIDTSEWEGAARRSGVSQKTCLAVPLLSAFEDLEPENATIFTLFFWDFRRGRVDLRARCFVCAEKNDRERPYDRRTGRKVDFRPGSKQFPTAAQVVWKPFLTHTKKDEKNQPPDGTQRRIVVLRL